MSYQQYKCIKWWQIFLKLADILPTFEVFLETLKDIYFFDV